jgi:hypothetical protein
MKISGIADRHHLENRFRGVHPRIVQRRRTSPNGTEHWVSLSAAQPVRKWLPAIEKMLNLIGFVVAKSERNSELGMHEQTDLVAL